MVDRLEIPKPVKLAVFKRAGGPEDIHCEGCGQRLGAKAFHYDHTMPEWLQSLPKSERKITAADVKLLGEKCCHGPKTAREAGERSKDYAVLEKSARARAKPSRPLPGSRASPWKAKIGGGVEHRSAKKKSTRFQPPWRQE